MVTSMLRWLTTQKLVLNFIDQEMMQTVTIHIQSGAKILMNLKRKNSLVWIVMERSKQGIWMCLIQQRSQMEMCPMTKTAVWATSEVTRLTPSSAELPWDITVAWCRDQRALNCLRTVAEGGYWWVLLHKSSWCSFSGTSWQMGGSAKEEIKNLVS